jgi:hypothetical protein
VVEIFKTNVEKISESKVLLEKLSRHFPEHKINFDLSDWERILRVQGNNISVDEIIRLLKQENYKCEVLD